MIHLSLEKCYHCFLCKERLEIKETNREIISICKIKAKFGSQEQNHFLYYHYLDHPKSNVIICWLPSMKIEWRPNAPDKKRKTKPPLQVSFDPILNIEPQEKPQVFSVQEFLVFVEQMKQNLLFIL